MFTTINNHDLFYENWFSCSKPSVTLLFLLLLNKIRTLSRQLGVWNRSDQWTHDYNYWHYKYLFLLSAVTVSSAVTMESLLPHPPPLGHAKKSPLSSRKSSEGEANLNKWCRNFIWIDEKVQRLLVHVRFLKWWQNHLAERMCRNFVNFTRPESKSLPKLKLAQVMRRLYFRRVLDSGLRSFSVGACDAFPKSDKLSRLNNAQFADFDTH